MASQLLWFVGNIRMGWLSVFIAATADWTGQTSSGSKSHLTSLLSLVRIIRLGAKVKKSWTHIPEFLALLQKGHRPSANLRQGRKALTVLVGSF